MGIVQHIKKILKHQIQYKKSRFHFPFSVRPSSTKIIGKPGEVKSGEVVTLMCRSEGARPPAVLTWYNGSTPLAELATVSTAIQVRMLQNFKLCFCLLLL